MGIGYVRKGSIEYVPHAKGADPGGISASPSDIGSGKPGAKAVSSGCAIPQSVGARDVADEASRHGGECYVDDLNASQEE